MTVIDKIVALFERKSKHTLGTQNQLFITLSEHLLRELGARLLVNTYS